MTRLDKAVDVRAQLHDVRTQIEAGVPVCALRDEIKAITDVCRDDSDPTVAMLAMLLANETKPARIIRTKGSRT